jgi:hypothetical protein
MSPSFNFIKSDLSQTMDTTQSFDTQARVKGIFSLQMGARASCFHSPTLRLLLVILEVRGGPGGKTIHAKPVVLTFFLKEVRSNIGQGVRP